MDCGWDEYYDNCGGDYGELYREEAQAQYMKTIKAKQDRYDVNKTVSVGCLIPCANCSKVITKNVHSTQFCSNKGRGNCKDTYWNNVSTKRRERSWDFKQ